MQTIDQWFKVQDAAVDKAYRRITRKGGTTTAPPKMPIAVAPENPKDERRNRIDSLRIRHSKLCCYLVEVSDQITKLVQEENNQKLEE